MLRIKQHTHQIASFCKITPLAWLKNAKQAQKKGNELKKQHNLLNHLSIRKRKITTW